MDLDLEEMIGMFNDPIYLQFQSLLKETNELKFNGKKLVIDAWEITLPETVDIFKRSSSIEEERRLTLFELYRLHQEIIHSENPSSKVHKDKYNSLIEKVRLLDEEYEILRAYFIKINHLVYGVHVETLSNELDNSIMTSKRIYDNLMESDHYDKANLKKLVKKNLQILQKKEQLEHLQNFARITYYISKLPKIEPVGKAVKTAQIKEQLKVVKKKQPKLSDEQKGKIVSNIKTMLKDKFKFVSKDECVSKAKSKSYYMSKEEILKVIEDNPEIKQSMPKNYKSLNKDQLCEYMTQ
jgi:hypothetical protein